MKKTLNIGLIGTGFMGKAHSMAYSVMPMFFPDVAAVPVKHTIFSPAEQEAKSCCEIYGFKKYSTDWREVVNDPEIDIIDIVTPNAYHVDIAIAAAKAKKHIFCEKPLADTTEGARKMLDAVNENNVKTMVAFNYRHTPAVALAKKYIEDGKIGKILNFRGQYLQDWSASMDTPMGWRFDKNVAGTGAIGDIGTHVIDIARYLVSDISEVCATVKNYIPERYISENGTMDGKADPMAERAKVDVDDEFLTLINFECGAVGSIESTRNAWGRSNFLTFEIHGEEGSIYFDYERRDELQIALKSDPADARGFKTVLTGPEHPYGKNLWPIPALGIGYSEVKIIECYNFIQSIVEGSPTPDFTDGYKISLISDAIIDSAREHNWKPVK